MNHIATSDIRAERVQFYREMRSTLPISFCSDLNCGPLQILTQKEERKTNNIWEQCRVYIFPGI